MTIAIATPDYIFQMPDITTCGSLTRLESMIIEPERLPRKLEPFLKPVGFDAILPPIKLIAHKPLSPLHLYPKELRTIGDQIRKRRLDLGLMQKEVAAIIGVTTCTIKCWERNKYHPHARYHARIVEFLATSH